MKVTSKTAWSTFSNHLHNFIRSKVNNKIDAEDILQDVFVKVHLNIHQLKEEDKLQSWIFNITRNTINNYWRKKSQKENYVHTELDENPDNDWVIPFENCISKMIYFLPEEERDLIIRSEINGEKQKDIAHELKIPYPTIKSRIQRGREHLKQQFKDCCQVEISKSGQFISGNNEMDSCSKCS